MNFRPNSTFRSRRIALLIAILCSLLLNAQPPGSFESLASEAAAARDANRLDTAASLYRQALAIHADWKEGWWSLGTIEYDSDQCKNAAAAFEKLAALDSKSGSARVMLGLCEFELGQDSAALAHIQEGEHIGVADNQQLRNVALFHEGVLLQRAGKFESSQKALYSLCLGGVDTPELTTVLGIVALRIRDRNPPATDVVNRVGRAECLAAQKKFDDARRDYGALVHEYPDLLNLHYAFGRLLLDAHDTTAGIAELEAEIKLHPDNAIARLQIAAADYKVDSAAGLPFAQDAVQLDPTLPFGHYLLGLLLLDTGDYLRAIPELETAQRSMPAVPNVYSALGAAYSRAGRDDDAAHARAQFKRLKSDDFTAAALSQ